MSRFAGLGLTTKAAVAYLGAHLGRAKRSGWMG
jgi:hypothetical protein